ncbi:MAG: 4-hydroxy-3-methylbut-2-enyl diphosphate reductase [Actinobacteria bacterium]|nr:MAG: 4-hydroxy-3-methylbut-2-enyl diphosphate reductase [Actinomycetota bacterium]
MIVNVERVLLAAPRGYCAGVDRAVETVERALLAFGAPIYVRKQIVHNLPVVRDLESKGAIFVEELEEVPLGATVILSAHGVAPEVYAQARARELRVIDATCPLVTKVHNEAKKFARDGYHIVLIGHEGHEEVVGTMGEASASMTLIGAPDEADSLDLPADDKVAYLSQTTLSVDETNDVIERLRARFPVIQGPPREDICYATQNRQTAVKVLAEKADVVLVIGSDNSSNSNRLAEVAAARGARSYLIDDETEIEDAWLEGAHTVGITSGASAPEWLVDRVVGWFRARGVDDVEEVRVVEEDVHFALPKELEQA